MKKIFFSALCAFTFFSASAQSNFDIGRQTSVDAFTRRNTELYREGRLNTEKYEKAIGSAYTIEKFTLATISGVPEAVSVRYNAEADSFEVQNNEANAPADKKFFALPKQTEYSNIDFKNGTYKFRLLNYKDVNGKEVNGYLIEKFSKNDVVLYKKEKINYIKGRVAENSYAMDSPAKLVRAKDEFYLQLKSKQIVEFPKNKKKLIALFEDKKEAINTYLKTNDPSFSDENDMVKIAEFVSTL